MRRDASREACFLGPRALIHVPIDAKCGLEGDESGIQRTAANRQRGNSVVTGKHEGNECVVVVSHPAASLGEVIVLYLTYLRLRALSLDNIDVINGSSY
jgi:hypothetical protein